MAELTRQRRRPEAMGMGAPFGVGDDAARQAIGELQAAIESVARRIPAAQELVEGADPFDPSELERKIAALNVLLDGVRLALEEILGRFPIVQYVKVVTPGTLGTVGDPGNGYHECVFWYPQSALEGAPVNVAAGTEPEAGDVLLAARLYAGLVDGNGFPVAWQEIAVGGRGGVIIAENYAALNALTGLEDGDIGYTLDKDYFYHRRAGEWRIAHAFSGVTAPNAIGETAGDDWWNGSARYFYTGAGWKSYTHWVDEDV